MIYNESETTSRDTCTQKSQRSQSQYKDSEKSQVSYLAPPHKHGRVEHHPSDKNMNVCTKTEFSTRTMFGYDTIEKLKDLETKVASETSLLPDQISEAIKDIRQGIIYEFQQVEANRQNMETNLMLMTRQRDFWKCEAAKNEVELKSLKIQNHYKAFESRKDMQQEENAEFEQIENEVDDEKLFRSKDEEIMHWKIQAENLAMDLDKSQCEQEKILSMMSHRQAEFMDMMNDMNKEMSTLIIKKKEESKGLLDYINANAKTLGRRNQSINQILKNLELCKVDNNKFSVERLHRLERYPSLIKIEHGRTSPPEEILNATSTHPDPEKQNASGKGKVTTLNQHDLATRKVPKRSKPVKFSPVA